MPTLYHFKVNVSWYHINLHGYGGHAWFRAYLLQVQAGLPNRNRYLKPMAIFMDRCTLRAWGN
jgi:hypothetical protein